MSRIALVMIVRDEAPRLERCLASAAQYVDRMIVLDTGSTDGSQELARSLGAEVHHFDWVDDFSAARNAALDLSDADWNLVLDADEWIDEGGEALAEVVHGDRKFLGAVRILNVMDLDGSVEQSSTWNPRLLPAGVRFSGRIHEQPVSDLPRYRIDVQLGHDGYVLFQTGKTLQVYGDYPAAADYLTRALAHTRADEPFRHPVVVNTIYSLKMAGRVDEALAVLEAEFETWQTSPDFLFVMGDLYLEQASLHPDEALQEHLPLVEYAWKRCLEVGDQDRLEGSVRGRGSHMAAHNLSVLYGSLGQAEKAEHYAEMAARMRGQATS